MKKFVALLLAATLSVSMLAGCGDKKDGGTDNGTNNQGENQNGGNQTSTGESIVVTDGDVAYTINESVVSGAASIDMGSLYVADSMIDTGIQRPGNVQKIAEALSKAASGSPLTIAFIGGNATMGDGASAADKKYSALVMDWFKKTFPSSSFTEVDLVQRNLDSYVADHRVASAVLNESPDIVIIETARGDQSAAVAEESFECLIRQLLQSSVSPAIIPLVTTDASLNNYGTVQAQIAFKYDLPMINYALVAKSSTSEGTWKWTDISDDKGNDPNDAAHAFIANLITTYFKRVLGGMSQSKYKTYVIPEKPSTKCRYMSASFLSESKVTAASGFSLKEIPDADFEPKKAWCSTDGTEGVFQIKGSNIGLVFAGTINGLGGNYSISVDGQVVRDKVIGSALSADATDDEKAKAKVTLTSIELGKFDNGTHEIKITKLSDSAEDDFYVLGFCVSQ